MDGRIVGELSVVNEISGNLSVMPTLNGIITVPDRIIPSNYGLITWNGAYLTVS